MFYENGPYQFNASGGVVENPHGWDVNAHMVFVDQPLGTGFSYTTDDRDRCGDEECVSDDMVDFFQALYAARPALRGQDVYVTGESYAGHYVPAVASKFFRDTARGDVTYPIALRGVAIGNGLTEPGIQYGAYGDYLLEAGRITQGVHDAVALTYPGCRLALQGCDAWEWAPACVAAVAYCQLTVVAPLMSAAGDMNVYDIRLPCVGPLCYDFSAMGAYLNRADVRAALGVGDRRWEECSPDVHADMMGDWGRRYDGLLPELLAAGVRTLVYAGDQDFICNWIGNSRWLAALDWPHAQEWRDAPDLTWFVGTQPAGLARTTHALTFLRVYQAGHMVPMDQPAHALDMITRFIRNETFGHQIPAVDANPRERAAGRVTARAHTHRLDLAAQ